MNRSKTRLVLGVIAIIGFITVTIGFYFLLFFGDRVRIPEGQLGIQIVGMLGMLVGNWIAIVMMVYAFHYGTSQGSQDKGEAQTKLLEGITSVGQVGK